MWGLAGSGGWGAVIIASADLARTCLDAAAPRFRPLRKAEVGFLLPSTLRIQYLTLASFLGWESTVKQTHIASFFPSAWGEPEIDAFKPPLHLSFRQWPQQPRPLQSQAGRLLKGLALQSDVMKRLGIWSCPEAVSPLEERTVEERRGAVSSEARAHPEAVGYSHQTSPCIPQIHVESATPSVFVLV